MTDAELSALWRAYSRDRRQTDLRNRLWVEYLPLVRDVGRRLKRKLVDAVDLEDLVSAGGPGLLDAIERFDPGRGVKFKSWSYRRIRGAMLDALREGDRISRNVRKNEKRLSETRERLRGELGRPPSAEEMAVGLGMTEAEFLDFEAGNRVPGLGSLEDLIFRGPPDGQEGQFQRIDVVADRRAPDPAGSTRRRDLLREISKGLDRRERLIIILYYYEGLTMREIGEALDLNPSRISQIHADLLDRLRRRRDDFAEGAGGD